MDWHKRAQESFQHRGLCSFVVDGTRFVVRRTISRGLVSALSFVDADPAKEFRYGSKSMTTIEGGEEGLPESYAERAGTYENPSSYVKEFEDIRLVGPYALGFSEPRGVVAETAGGDLHLLWPTISGMIKQEGLRDTFREIQYNSSPQREFDYAVSLVSFNAKNYYHWITEHLPQLRGVEHYVEQEGVSPVLILPQNPPSWIIDSLALCGYDKDSWVEWDSGPVHVNHLIVPEHPFRSMEIDFPPAPENFQWLRERFISNADPNSVANIELSPYVYISREDANSRRIVNREELLEELRPLGFKSYVLSELSFEQQVVLFSQAEVIVAPHGAGATNMVFANDVTFIELIHSGNVRGAHFFLLAQECGHKYVSHLCEPVGVDMRVDVQKFTTENTFGETSL